ncbi:MAG: hypothetical protein LBD70_08020, partial [Bifidobacteriaceae bacterium]|nr:hypothetical protein [Bifidobacteriaceae bacterium]
AGGGESGAPADPTNSAGPLGDAAFSLLEAEVAPGLTRLTGLDNSLVVTAPPVGKLISCLVEAEPGARAGLDELLVGWFDEPARVLVTSAMAGAPLGASPVDELSNRLSRWAPAAVAVFVLAFQAALWLSRRADLGLYGLLGMRGGGLAAMVATEFAFTVAAPGGAGALLAATALAPRLEGVTLALTAWDCLRTAALLALVALAVVGLLRLVKPFDAIRGR